MKDTAAAWMPFLVRKMKRNGINSFEMPTSKEVFKKLKENDVKRQFLEEPAEVLKFRQKHRVRI